ncbi:16S rRNA (guanine(527)-N(7))-methyltransferase RsmG [Roseovarius pelagicus]|uniref:Ribosomal RNA small subunit methyltransferase G n=1 Tax=Roseovarius pelagicus TaxID=2980108 RepID=A0ABY6D6W2_9RHOB|nr:16S rRNA (guanine(527)-N(7))-methyltransferase RsmG [Roseovarius pelagicus]UXX81884.1 16S rRNA (guanine(527)-N(7))-methyltransferase RsmG [Roseovarius pelagicus]
MTDQTLPDVSRETNERLQVYAELLRKWNSKINLVSRASLHDLWARHIVDSAQIAQLAPERVEHWADLGSGGGFPGIVAAILLQETRPTAQITLVESDQRKCAFLRTVLRETECVGTVIAERIEKLPPLSADVLSARALADLSSLLGYADHHLSSDGVALFPKGTTWKEEVKEAQSKWHFDLEVATSLTDPAAAILKISGVSRV